MNDQIWSWLLSVVGVGGFILAGRKIWWAWYINIACQALWFTYAIVTEQWGFIVGAFFYSAVFIDNARKWTKEHLEKRRQEEFLNSDLAKYAILDVQMTLDTQQFLSEAGKATRRVEDFDEILKRKKAERDADES